jgi:DNA-binding transcriptional LysR family regulator
MHFFVNRRAVQSRMLGYAVEEAYHSLLMVGRRPICMVNVLIDPTLLDVNVHPAKAEVKFRDERAVFSAVQRSVRSALTAHVPAPAYGSRGAGGWAVPNSEGLGLEFSPPFPGFYLYYPQRRHASAALRALVDHLRGARRKARAPNASESTPGAHVGR